MNPQKHAEQADQQLHEALAAFEQSVLPEPERPAPALPALVGLLRAIAGLARFALTVVLDGDRSDPIHLEPRVLRA